MKKTKCILIGMAAGLLVTGCAGRMAAGGGLPKTSCIYIDKDGGISSVIAETYGEGEEDPEGLKAEAQSAAIEYNTQKGAGALAENSGDSQARLPVALRTSSMEKGTATLVFDYATGQDLVDFSAQQQDETVTVTGIEVEAAASALAQGKASDTSFLKAKDGSAADKSQITEKGRGMMVTVHGEGTVRTEKKVVYISSGVSMVDDYTAKTPEGTSYIIYK